MGVSSAGGAGLSQLVMQSEPEKSSVFLIAQLTKLYCAADLRNF